MKKIILTSFVLSLFMWSCEKTETDSNPSTPDSSDVNLSSPEVGQISLYRHFAGSCDDLNPQFTPDTLILEVVAGSNGLLLQESFTEGSVNYGNFTPITYPIVDQGEYLLFNEDRMLSSLFYFYGNDTLWKNPVPEVELSKSGCFLEYPNGDPFIGDEIGHIALLDLGIEVKQDLKVVSCVPFFELDAYLNYTPANLEVSYGLIPGILDEPSYDGWSLIH